MVAKDAVLGGEATTWSLSRVGRGRCCNGLNLGVRRGLEEALGVDRLRIPGATMTQGKAGGFEQKQQREGRDDKASYMPALTFH